MFGSFAYLATALFGIPAYIVFRALRWTRLFSFLVGGACIGLVASLFIMGFPFDDSLDRLGERAWCALAGALSALMFRIISGEIQRYELNAVP